MTMEEMIMDALAREERLLQEQLENDEISLSQYNREMRKLEKDYGEAAHESAQRAYDDELERW